MGVKDAAGLLGVSSRQIYNFIYAKSLPSRRLGGRRVLLVSDLKKFVRSDQAVPAPRR